MTKTDHPAIKKSNWRGFTLQLFLISVLPLTLLLLVVAFGSQALHNKAMRSLVGDRDLTTVRAASSSIERELNHLTSTLQLIGRNLNGSADFNSLIFNPEEINSAFDGGIALYSADGSLIQASSNSLDWLSLPTEFPDIFRVNLPNEAEPLFSTLITQVGSSHPYIFLSSQTNQHEILIGAFSPDRLIGSIIGDLVNSGKITVLAISRSNSSGNYNILYRAGPIKVDENNPSHPGINESLNGESGINYYQSSEGEHVVAFTPIQPTGWGLVAEEAWQDIASPYLITTQSAPLVIVPVFILAIIAIWFGARRIVTPLQRLEHQAASLSMGDFKAIRQPVGGIEEIRNLQVELVDMADKLSAAQQSLHSYIGAITAGIENERRSISRELHDDTIQALIALNQRIQLAMRKLPDNQKDALNELLTLVDQSITNLRRLIRGLRPLFLEDLGLVASIEMLVQEVEQSASLPISFTTSGQENRLSPNVEMSLYRMVQESLNNVIHHAEAKHAWVNLAFSDNRLTVQVRDDGKGFSVPANSIEFSEKGHFGLLGLLERAELINAELKILSTPGKGTTVTISTR